MCGACYVAIPEALNCLVSLMLIEGVRELELLWIRNH